ncbi:MAG: dTDP-4-dehydrorhamnose reductase [Candidatus Zixiibacteriota bacterium]
MKDVLLVGANGQLGLAIQQVLGRNGLGVTPLTRREFDADHDDAAVALAEYREHRYLINCIAYHKVDLCEDNFDRSFKINGQLVMKLAHFCSNHNITLMHISTDYVFDGRKPEAYVETDRPSPINVYGASKLAGEILTAAYAGKYFVFRVSSLFGYKKTTDPNVNFVEKMIHAAREKRPLKVIDNQIMSPTYTVDAAAAIGSVIKQGVTDYGIYHACNSGECSWYEFARTIFELTGLDNDLAPVSYDQFHTHAPRPQFCSMNNAKLAGFHKMRQWREALADYLRVSGYVKG